MAASSIRSNGLFPRRWERSSSSSEFEEEEEEEVHVLAVDDSVVDRKVIERLLKITSCKVTTVESGWRALQYLGLDQDYKTTSPPPPPPPPPNHHHHHHDFNVNGMKVDLIITDYCMPGMTGYELLKKIKGSATFREIPVVIMSSENVVARIDRCLEEGAEDFIVKPVKLSDVKRLKDYMFGSDNRATIPAAATTSNIINNHHHEDKTIISSFNKRKLQEIMSSSPSPSPSPSTSPTMSPASTSQSPPTTTSSSPPSSLSSSSMSPDPFSPSQLESPTMRLKVTNSSSSSDDDDDDQP